jgi:hypothetical protein
LLFQPMAGEAANVKSTLLVQPQRCKSHQFVIGPRNTIAWHDVSASARVG